MGRGQDSHPSFRVGPAYRCLTTGLSVGETVLILDVDIMVDISIDIGRLPYRNLECRRYIDRFCHGAFTFARIPHDSEHDVQNASAC